MKKLSKLFGSKGSLPSALALVFGVWVLYRLVFQFPVWVDEIFVKAVVFGLPAWIFARSIKNSHKLMGFTNELFWKGMFSGLLLGGFYEIVGVFAYMYRGTTFMRAHLFASPLFLEAFFLAMMTAWWESLFFFAYVLNRTIVLFKQAEIPAIIMTSTVFVLFHAPLRFLITGVTPLLWAEMFVLFLFAVGQSILFLRTKSIFSVVISHALWGMVLLIYTG